MKRFTISILISGLLFACATLVMEGCNATSQTKKDSGDSISEKGGAQLWGENCRRCHNIPLPTEWSHSQWEVIARHMRIRCNLTGEEERKILQFLKSIN